MDLEGAFRARHLLQRRENLQNWRCGSRSQFSHTLSGKQEQRNNATPTLFGIHHALGGVALLRRQIFEPLFTTHPSEVGSTTPWTVLAAMLRGPLSDPICRQTIAFCGVLSAIQGASAWSSCHEMCHRIPWLSLATNCT